MIVIVTGANRGLGRSICNMISQRPDFHLYATSRQGFELDNSQCEVNYPKLDIASTSSIKSLAGEIQQKHRKIDVLINNAGLYADDEPSIQNTKKTIATNYHGTRNMCNAFLPLLKDGGRIVNVSSVASSLGQYSDKREDQIKNISNLEELDKFVDEYVSAREDGDTQDKGFGGQHDSYGFTKACMNVLTEILARENPNLLINAMCPGWVDSDMGKQVGDNPAKHPDDGAKIVLRLAFEDIDGVSGRFWANDSVSSTEMAHVMPK